jgi:hypothetical protein
MPYPEIMKLLSLDYDSVYGSNVVRAAFSSDTSVFDYDVVIWDPDQSPHNYEVSIFQNNPTYRGLPSLSDDASVRITDMASKYTKLIVMAEIDTLPGWLRELPNVRYWQVEDPQGKKLGEVRHIRNKIKKLIDTELLTENATDEL